MQNDAGKFKVLIYRHISELLKHENSILKKSKSAIYITQLKECIEIEKFKARNGYEDILYINAPLTGVKHPVVGN